MSKFLQAVGNFISSFYQYGENYFFAVICFALLLKLLFLYSSFKYFKCIKMSEALSPEVAKINQKHKNNKDKANQEVTQLLMQNGYSLFGGIWLFVLHAAVGIIVSLTFKDAYVYLQYAKGGNISFYGLDLTKSIIKMFMSADVQYSGLIALALFIFALGLQVYIDVLMERKLITEQSSANKIIWALTALGLLFAPSAFGVCWFIFKLFDLCTYIYVVKFYKAKFVLAKEKNVKAKKHGK